MNKTCCVFWVACSFCSFFNLFFFWWAAQFPHERQTKPKGQEWFRNAEKKKKKRGNKRRNVINYWFITLETIFIALSPCCWCFLQGIAIFMINFFNLQIWIQACAYDFCKAIHKCTISLNSILKLEVCKKEFSHRYLCIIFSQISKDYLTLCSESNFLSHESFLSCRSSQCRAPGHRRWEMGLSS